MKKIVLFLAAVFMMVACDSGKVSYKGFSFSVPDTYSLNKSKMDDGLQCLLVNKEDADNYAYIEITNDFIESLGGQPDNAQISEALAEAMYDVCETFIFDDKDAEVDMEDGVNFGWNDDPDEEIFAEGQIVGTYEGKPFYAYTTAALWGPQAVVSLFIAFQKEELKYQIDNILKTYEWKK